MAVKKGERGYIEDRKKRALAGVLAMAAAGIAVFLAGMFLNKMSTRNIFTIMAVLFVLPGAQYMVRFIVMFPYRTVEVERYDAARRSLGGNMRLYSDLVITSAEKVMNLDMVAIGNNCVIGLLGRKGQDVSYIRKYLSDGVSNWGDGYRVKIFEDEKLFIREISNVAPREVNAEQEENVKSYIMSLIV